MNTRFLFLSIIALSFLSSCFSSDLRQIQLQTLSVHEVSFPVSQDTTTIMELVSTSWVTDWDSVRINAGIDASDISEAVPSQVILIINTPDSTFVNLDELSVYSQTNNGSVLMASLSETASKSSNSLSLFTFDDNHISAFQENNAQFIFRYRNTAFIDTVWDIQMGVVWEMKGEW